MTTTAATITKGRCPFVTYLRQFAEAYVEEFTFGFWQNNMHHRTFLRVLAGAAGLSVSAAGFDTATASPVQVQPLARASSALTPTEHLDPLTGLLKIVIIDDDWAGELQTLIKLMLVPIPRLAEESSEEYGERIEATIDTKVKEAGFDLEFVGDADEAFKRYCERGPYDLVTTDLCHPGMEVSQLIPAIRQKHPSQVIALITAAHDPELPKRLKVPVLWKPFETKRFRKFVYELIGRGDSA